MSNEEIAPRKKKNRATPLNHIKKETPPFLLKYLQTSASSGMNIRKHVPTKHYEIHDGQVFYPERSGGETRL